MHAWIARYPGDLEGSRVNGYRRRRSVVKPVLCPLTLILSRKGRGDYKHGTHILSFSGDLGGPGGG
jgi:hypothetical protein